MGDEEFKELKQIIEIAKSNIQNLQWRADNSSADWHTHDEEQFHSGVARGIEEANEEFQNTIDDIEKLIKNIEKSAIFNQIRKPSAKQKPLL